MKFESYEEVHEYLSHEEITCLFCGKSFRFLGGHIRQAHNIHAKEYRELFNLPLHAPLAGLSYRAAHREVMKENFALGLIKKPDYSPEKMREIAKKAAGAKALHSGATKRVYIYKGYKVKYKSKHIERAVKKARAKAAQQMGDPSLMQVYQKEIERDRAAKNKRWDALGVKTNNEVAAITGIMPRSVREYAPKLGVTWYKGFGKYGWTGEEIDRLITAYPDARSKGAIKAWETKRKKAVRRTEERKEAKIMQV